jgi:hypothetical protein
MAVSTNDYQAIALHSSNGLRDSGARLVETFGNASAHRNLTLFLKFEDGAEVHFRGVNEIGHVALHSAYFVQDYRDWGGFPVR